MNTLTRLVLGTLLTSAVILLQCCTSGDAGKDDAEKGAEEQAATTPLEPATWRTFHGDTSLTGTSNAVLPDTLEMAWRSRADEKIYNPPVSDGKCWYVATFHGRVFALDFEGKEMWNTQLWAGEGPDGQPQKATVDAPPACFGNALYIATARGVLHALDTSNGAERWKLETDGTYLGTMTYGTLPGPPEKEVVFALSQDDGTVYCVDPETGTLLWEAVGPERCDGSPSFYGGNIVFGSCAAALHIVSAADGAHVRDIPIDEDSQIAAGVAIDDGAIFAGCRSGKFLNADLATGVIKWVNQDSQDEIFTTPAVNDALVVFSSRDGAVYCLDRATGTQKWKFPTEGEPQSPVIVGDKVAVSADGTLYLLRLETGASVWSRKVSDEISSPAVLNNQIVVAGEDGAVTAFGPPQPLEE